ncbi:MAG: hypothetical protein LBE86_12175 [Gemmobacter sp.]|nr:hypothetical protein [Gemmobacter sp.]
MFRLILLVFSMAATTLAGAAVVAVLTLGHVTLSAIVTAAVVGFVAAVPVSWFVARQISS